MRATTLAAGGLACAGAAMTIAAFAGGGHAQPAAQPQVQANRGEVVFAREGCSGCHTLAAAGSNGTVGPNLDDAKPPATLVVTRVTDGAGAMPSFKGKLTEQQIQDVAAYVSSAAGTS